MRVSIYISIRRKERAVADSVNSAEIRMHYLPIIFLSGDGGTGRYLFLFLIVVEDFLIYCMSVFLRVNKNVS